MLNSSFLFARRDVQMERSSQLPVDRCECGGKAKPGKGDQRSLMICQRPSCKKRWLVQTCACGNKIDYRYQQFCERGFSRCDLKPYNICTHGEKAQAGTGSIEGVMFCSERDCGCHHSRWAYYKCEHCGNIVDYRYAAMCTCKQCIESRQYWRICPVCGQCPSISHKSEKSEIVRATARKSTQASAPRASVSEIKNKQQQLLV